MSLRSNKNVLCGLLGYCGGTVGALTAELVNVKPTTNTLVSIGHVALWCAVCSVGIVLGLTWALEIYAGRKRPSRKVLLKALISGLITGAIAGGAAQGVFRLHTFSRTGQFFFQAGCWGLAGGIIGWRISRLIANLGTLRGIAAGLAGGTLGGMGFLAISGHLAEAFGRSVGFGVLGAILGVTMVVAERLFREAYLEVIWAPREVTTLSLGTAPVSIGGGEDNIFVRGLPPRTATITLDGGKVRYVDQRTGKAMDLANGTRITVAQIQMVVHASA